MSNKIMLHDCPNILCRILLEWCHHPCLHKVFEEACKQDVNARSGALEVRYSEPNTHAQHASQTYMQGIDQDKSSVLLACVWGGGECHILWILNWESSKLAAWEAFKGRRSCQVKQWLDWEAEVLTQLVCCCCESKPRDPNSACVLVYLHEEKIQAAYNLLVW